MQKYQNSLTNSSGQSIVGARVLVTTLAGATAVIYSDNGVTRRANPIVVDGAQGEFSFYAANGRYTLTTTGANIAPDITSDIILYDPSDGLPDYSAPTGAGLVGTPSGDTLQVLLNALSLADYTALRAYAGNQKSAYVTGYLVSAAPSGIAGLFTRDDSDTTSADNGGTIIVAVNGKRWKRAYSGAVSVQWFGAKGDGVTDDTAAIQAAFNAGTNISIPPVTYLINPVDPAYPASSYGGGVKPQNGSTIRFMGGAKFIIAANAANAYVLMNLRATENVTIYDGEVVGDVGTHTGTTGEWGMGYYVASATNPRLFNCKASKCWGDGFYVGAATGYNTAPVTGGLLSNCVADDNRRQGLSIVSWSKGLVLGGEFKNTGLTAFAQPAYGIDIEPDNSGYDVIDVTLIGIRTANNHFGGLQLVPGFMSADTYTRPKFNVRVIGIESFQDDIGIRFAYPDLANVGVNVANKIYGSIQIDSPKIIQSAKQAIDFARWVPTAPDVVINDPGIIDPNESGSTATQEDQCGIVFFVDSANLAYQTSTGAVTINNPNIVDTRSVPKMLVPIWTNSGTGQSVDGLVVRNAKGSGWSSTANGLTRIVNTQRGEVVYDTPPRKDFSASDAFANGAWAGYAIAASVDSVLTLPTANTSIGLEYFFVNNYGKTIQVRPNAADTITNYGMFAGNDAVLRAVGDRLRVKSIGSNTWEVVAAQGGVTPLGFSSPGRLLWAAAAPTTGTWKRGDRVLNVTPAVGSPKSWVCTVAGTPGTWVSEGNL
jgi:hypothetical protein